MPRKQQVDCEAVSPKAFAKLSLESRRQFDGAFRRRHSDLGGLWTYFLKPQLMKKGAEIYLPLLPRKRYAGWRPEHGDALVEAKVGDCDLLGFSPFFTLPLRRPKRDRAFGVYEDGSLRWEPAAQRLVNAGFWVFTMEIDVPSLGMLEQQLSWCRGERGKQQTSPMGAFDRELCRYLDYRGVTAVWSGNKSIHFHFVFDIRHLSRALSVSDRRVLDKWQGDVEDGLLKDLYRQRWFDLAAAFEQKFPCAGLLDRNFASALQLRRTPWGVRTVKQDHILGVEPGAIVLQAMLLDLVRQRAPNGSNNWFIHPSQTAAAGMCAATASRRTSIASDHPPEVLEKLQDWCREHWNADYPRPVKLDCEAGEHVVQFANHSGDRHASSIVRGPYRRLLLCGRHSFDGPVFLPQELTLDETIDMLSGVEPSRRARPHPTECRSWWEANYSRGASSAGKARESLANLLRLLSSGHRHVVIKSIEGIGKTRVLLQAAPLEHFDAWADRSRTAGSLARPPGFLAFAFRSYEQARAKCKEFNDIHQNTLFEGKVLPSFSRLYRESCAEMGVTPLDTVGAAQSGCQSFQEAVEAMHSAVFAKMCDRRAFFWKSAAGDSARPDPLRHVLFTSHGLVQNWGGESASRRWWSFDCASSDEEEQSSGSLMISRLIHDEFSHQDLVDIIPEPTWVWCKSVSRSAGCWEDAGLSGQYNAYLRRLESCRDPGMTFDRCRRIIAEGFGPRDVRQVDVSTAPFGHDHNDEGIYRRMNGAGYVVRTRRWWQALGARVTMLTTEELPSRIAEQIHWIERDARSGQAHKNTKRSFKVYRFAEASAFQNDVIPLVLDGRASSDRPDEPRLSALAEEIQNSRPGAIIISDRLGNRPGCITHQRAKGSNRLADYDLVTVLLYPHPELYAELCLLASEYQIADAVGLYYEDTLFQALGRNCGFRADRRSQRSHVVVMSPRLHRELQLDQRTAHARYRLTLRRARNELPVTVPEA